MARRPRYDKATGVGALIALLAGIWAIIVWQSGRGWNPSGHHWDFENTGQLGDSFGIVSALMTSVAAFFAYRTYQSARADADTLTRSAKEATYLNLLERRYTVLRRICVGERERCHGQDALDRIAAGIRQADTDGETWADDLAAVFHATSGLSNLFSFTYHLVAFADREFEHGGPGQPIRKSDHAYRIVRLLRVEMSESELLLVALNCVHGRGRVKFKPLVERYGLLHNMRLADVDQFRLKRHFAPSAFDIVTRS